MPQIPMHAATRTVRCSRRRMWVALPALLTMAGGAFAVDRPANPAHWPALKEVYKHHFLIGSTNLDAANFAAGVVPGEDSVAAMTLKHFNAVTPSNAMKPDFWSGGIGNPSPPFLTNLTSGINNDIRAANARGVKVTGHTLLWHNQSAQWPAANVATPNGGWETPWDNAMARTSLEYYIRTVAGHFDREPFKTYAWDVVNEAFKDNPENPADWRNALRTGYHPEERPSRWAQAYAKGGKGWDYMYDAFFHARQNTTALLNYNDFNDDERASKATAIAAMVREFNERYAAESAAGKGRVLLDAKGRPRPLVDVIGTQGHWDMRLNLDAFERTLQTYLDTGVDVDLTELDLAPTLGLDKGQRIQNGPEMDALFLEQGIQYAKLFSLLKEYAAGPGGRRPHDKGGVHRVTWWGMTDPGYHTNGYPWSAVGQPKEAYWAVTNPEKYLAEAGLPPHGVKASFRYGGETFKARTWGGKRAHALLDIHVPVGTQRVRFDADDVSLPPGFAVERMTFNPPDCAVTPGKPCHVTVTARGPAPAAAYRNVGVENTATFVLSFGQMAVAWMDAPNALAAPLSYAEVRFSDGVTRFRQYKTHYAADGMARASGASDLKAVPRHGRQTLVLSPQDRIAGPLGLRLARSAATEKTWRLARRIEPGRTYIVASATSAPHDDGETRTHVLTNRTKPATATSPESLSRTPVVLRGETLLPLRNANAPTDEPALAQDNHKFIFEASTVAGAQGHTMQSFIHGTNVYPHVVFRGHGANGTVVGAQHSLITRQTNGQEGSQIAERALGQAVWSNTPIDPRTGETRLFLSGGPGQRPHVLIEVADGTTPNRDAGNAISQRQGSVGGFVALQAGSPDEGTAVRLYAHDIEPYVPGDVDGDAALTCADVWAATAALGRRSGHAGFLPLADLDQDGVIDLRDVAVIWGLLPPGARCR